MAISPVNNQGTTPMAGVEKTVFADPFKKKEQDGTEKQQDAYKVSISSDAKQKAKIAHKPSG
jgi:hypothetical protein